jgi:hypothetical protein
VTLGEASGDRGQAAVWSRVLAALLGGNSCDLKEETLLKTRASRRPPRRRAGICLKRAGRKQEELFSAKLLLPSAVCQNATAERRLHSCSLPAPRRRDSHLARTGRLDANATREDAAACSIGRCDAPLSNTRQPTADTGTTQPLAAFTTAGSAQHKVFE